MEVKPTHWPCKCSLTAGWFVLHMATSIVKFAEDRVEPPCVLSLHSYRCNTCVLSEHQLTLLGTANRLGWTLQLTSMPGAGSMSPAPTTPITSSIPDLCSSDQHSCTHTDKKTHIYTKVPLTHTLHPCTCCTHKPRFPLSECHMSAKADHC